ncbi:MAG: radical SAM protein, partial [Acidiferrobacterales bacterium]
MIHTIYIEREIADYPRTREICDKFADAARIQCERYGEVFNPKAQNFRLQKQRPALILARKHDGMVLKTPEGYGIGGNHNYYFSHMLNCIYDCRYCFLQGMYRSAHYVLFVNYEDFETAIVSKISEANGEIIWFFSGYDCDSLALEPITGFVEHVLPLFARHPNAFIELRTKSTQVRSLLRTEPLPNCVVAFSFTPKEISAALENGVPPVEKRIDAMVRLQRQGWRLGLRFDPMIYHEDYQAHYRRLFTDLFRRLDTERLHSVTLGV